jgi:MBG domain (YGX type)
MIGPALDVSWRPSQTLGLNLRWSALFAFAAALLFSLSPVSATTPASLTVNPTTILSGDPVVVSGTGFPPNTPLMVWLDTNGNGDLDIEEPFISLSLVTDANGDLHVTPWVLTGVPAGSLTVYAGSCSDAPGVLLCVGHTSNLAQTQLTVNLGVNYSTFGSGTTVSVTGIGFAAGSNVNVWYDSDPNGALAGAMGSKSDSANSTGAVSIPLKVNGNPGDYFIHAGASNTAQYSIKVNIGTCWFQDCSIDGADTICLLGNSPDDLQFAGLSFADCKKVDSNYTNPTPITAAHNPPGGYDLNNLGPVFLGAGVLAAAANELGPPTSGCIAMTAAIANAEGVYHNSVPNKFDALLPIACAPNPLDGGLPEGVGLGTYIGALELCVDGIGPCNHVPDRDFILGVTAAVKLAGIIQPEILPLAQTAVAQAAVAGAIACGYVNYFCNGRDITSTILEHPDLQKLAIPLTFLQPPFKSAPNPNPCAAVGVNGTCWGDIIGWSRPTCKTTTSDYQTINGKKVGICERADVNDPTSFSQLAVPGSAGSPHNSGVETRCATGTVVGLSIGYDGDVSFDITGPDIFHNGSDGVSLVNYHNSEPGPGGSEPPNGLDIEIPWTDRPLFQSQINALRPGMTVRVCGRWVADMHMLWNELHPISALTLLTPLKITAVNKSRAYGAADPVFTVSYNGFVNGDGPDGLGGALSCSTTATTASPVGNYPINCSGQTSDTYGITYLPGTLSVTQAPLTITADNATRPYGAADPPFTSTPTGLLNGDALSSISVNPICTTSATAASPVGTYPITCSGPASTTNYTITYSTGTLTITQAALTVTANNAARLYGAANPAFTVSTAGLVNGNTLTSIGATPTCSTTATQASPVGSYPITCIGPSSTTNYTITYQAGTLSITPAPLTITANNATKILHAPNPALSASYSGFVNGDTPASLAGTLTCTTTATTASNVGSYPITCSGQSSTNYTITYVPGTLKILYASSGLCDGEAGHQILQPINPDGTSVWKQGRTIPAKFRVCDANGVSIGSPDVVSSFFLVRIITGTVSDVDESVDSTTPFTAFRWDPGAQQWIFNISTSPLAAGQTYVYAINLNDGSSIVFQYGLR